MNSPTLRLTDVTLRDGLQTETILIPTAKKLKLFELLKKCGYARLEVASFVSPKWVPQFADSDPFSSALFAKNPGIETMAFVPNLKGLERGLRFPYPWYSMFISASEAFNQKNINASRSETLAEMARVIETAHAQTRKVRAYVSVVFGCPYEGKLDPQQVLVLLKDVAALHPDEIALSDTLGVGTPSQVREMVKTFTSFYPAEKTALHLHNTYGFALSSALAAYDLGVRSFDGSTGGIGGCPYAAGATGNVALEDLAYWGAREGKAAIHLEAVREVANFLTTEIKMECRGSLSQLLQRKASVFGLENGGKTNG